MKTNKWFTQILNRLFRPKEKTIFTNTIKEYASFDIGRYTYGRPQIFQWGRDTKLVIGSYCSIGNGVKILLGGEHRTDWITTYPFSEFVPEAANIKGHPRTKGNVIIGHDVWIGVGAIILSGITIGNGAVIGAGSVVTKSVDSYAIVAGNPARLVRFRFEHNEILQLNSLGWWNWPVHKIHTLLPYLMQGDVNTFITKSKLNS